MHDRVAEVFVDPTPLSIDELSQEEMAQQVGGILPVTALLFCNDGFVITTSFVITAVVG